MLKKSVALVLALGMLFLGAQACAEIIPAHGMGQTGYQAVVLCESLTVRENRSTSSNAVRTLRNGDTFITWQNRDGWADCYISENQGPIGWVKSDYILIDPAWYKCDEATSVYAWNDTSAPKVALLDKGTLLPILKDDGSWLLVGLRGAVGWIQKTAAERTAEDAAVTIQNIGSLSMANLKTAKGVYTLLDEAGLEWIRENFSIAQPTSASKCPFDAELILFPNDSRPSIRLFMATDDCRVFRTEDGEYFTYGFSLEEDSSAEIGQAFWALFGNAKEELYR